VLLLLGIGFLGGLITALSPCIIPVLPVIAAGGSTGGGPWRPFAIVGGMVASFTAITLAGGELLSLLHLPKDLLWWLGIVMLFALAAGLILPSLGDLIERPFARLGAKGSGGFADGTANGALLGVSLGLVFTPCAGPVFATISVVANNNRVGVTVVLLTLAYALGAAVPLLALAMLARRTTTGWHALRGHLPMVRRVAGVVVGATALLLAFNATGSLTVVPGYVSSFENHLEQGSGVENQLGALRDEHGKNLAAGQSAAAGALPALGRAPAFTGISHWINTSGGKPVSLAGLRGKVVLVDFWTYSCINCQRELPHVEAWYAKYHRYGLEVVGVHTPEFPFEYVVSNVESAVGRLGVHFPVAVDDGYKTWDAYDNQYWPAEYLIDQNGEVRRTAFGEGQYATTENDIRLLLEAGGAHHLPPPTFVPNRTPDTQLTTETYLGYTRFDGERYQGSAVVPSRSSSYRLASTLSSGEFSFGGDWTQNAWEITAGRGAQLGLNYTADDIYLVLGGTGTVAVSVDGAHTTTVHVHGVPDLYTLVSSASLHSGHLSLTVSPGVKAYDFTFG
jgi:cytochrome c biogenesis protein CcdA/thiol-disulfide isomerase/thioredoxin